MERLDLEDTMTIDVADHLGAARREVRSGERDGKPTKTVVATRAYDSVIDDVWDALTSPERIPRWFLPISGELCVGGRYQFEGNAGGEIETCDAPNRLAVTWEYGGDVSWLEVRLTADGPERTTLELEHTAHPPEEFWGVYGPGAVGVGWDLALLGLGLHLATGEAVDPEVAATWPATSEGQAFVKQVSDAWGMADVADGEDEAAAMAAAERTTAFFTGVEEPRPEHTDGNPGEAAR
jgi:uncharacterized protein YndB with AHSA1/START domain